MVGGATPSRIASTEKIASTTPAAPSRCPVMDLVELTARRLACSPKARFIATVSALSPSGVEVACALTYCTSAGFRAASLSAFTIDRRAPSPSSGGAVARGEPLRLAEAPQPAARGGHFATAGDDQVRIAVLDGAHRQPDGVRRGGAGGDHAEIRALQAIADREVPGDHVDDGRGDEERRDLARAHRLQVLAVFGLDGPEATDAGAAHRAAACGIGLGEVDTGVADGLHSGRHAVLHEFVHAAGGRGGG